MSPNEFDLDMHERMARIEAEVEHIDKIVSQRHGDMQKISDKIDALEKDLERYRGTVGAILLFVTAITTFIKLFWQDLMRFVKG